MTRRGMVAALVALLAAAGAVAGWGTVPAPEAGGRAAGDHLDGAALFRAKGCASCHVGPETAAIASIGPDLSDAAAWAADRRPGMSAEDYIAESVRAPGAFVSPAFTARGGPVEAMPVLDVSDAELEVLVAYLLAD